jgi:small-conductance mechanosensitive channel
VVEVGVVSTRINTVVQEEVTVPNAVIVTTSISNYSRRGSAPGAVSSTGVTIGFDAPWRQVHALLEQAASQTPGIRPNPKPFVLQSALSDFYVEYQLYFHIERAEDRPFVLSRLHSEIQDAFNAAGVQIMSPHFMVQPSKRVTVPRSNWFASAASTEVDA